MRQLGSALVRGPGVLSGLAALGATVLLAAARPTAQPARPSTVPGEKASLSRLVIVDVKPESWTDYVGLERTVAILAMQHGGIEQRRAWRASGVGRAYQVTYLYPVTSLAAFDGPSPFVRSMGTEGAKAYEARVSKLLSGSRTLLLGLRNDLGFGPSSDVPRLAVLAHVFAEPSRQLDFETFQKVEWAPALKRNGVAAYVVHEVLLGGAIGEYYTFTAIDSFAVLDGGQGIGKPLAMAGSRALLGRMGAIVRSADREVVKLDEELSFDARAGAAK